MNKVEKIRREIEKRYEYWKEKESNSHSIESESRMSECQHLLLLFNSLQEEPVSNDLEEAAWQYYDRNKPLMPSEFDLHKELIDFFKAGVRWKEQNDSNLSEVLYRDNLDEMAEEYSSCTYLEEVLGEGDIEVLKARLKNTFKAGAQWQKERDQSTIELAEDHAYLAGQEKIIEKACEWLNIFYSEDRHCYFVEEDIDNFKKAMEE